MSYDSIDYTPGQGDYFAKPPTKRKNALGKYDITTPKSLIDTDDNYVTVLTTGENRHPNEDELIEHYARQLAAKKAGTYEPLEDPPVVLRDLLPTIFLVVNKTFTRREVEIGGKEALSAYVKQLASFIDFDIVPVMCGQPTILPLHPLTPAEHRDPIYNAQMQSFYKQHDKSAQELLQRVIAAHEEDDKKNSQFKKTEEQIANEQTALKEKAIAEAEAEVAAGKVVEIDEEDDEPKKKSWAELTDSEEEEEKEWKTVEKKSSSAARGERRVMNNGGKGRGRANRRRGRQ